MTALLTKLPSIEAEQFNLPGIEGFIRTAERYLQAMTGLDEELDRIPINPDQLRFGANQEPLSEPPAAPRQLPLLPDPPPWEADPPAPAHRARRRPAKRRGGREPLSPGQMSLF